MIHKTSNELETDRQNFQEDCIWFGESIWWCLQSIMCLSGRRDFFQVSSGGLLVGGVIAIATGNSSPLVWGATGGSSVAFCCIFCSNKDNNVEKQQTPQSKLKGEINDCLERGIKEKQTIMAIVTELTKNLDPDEVEKIYNECINPTDTQKHPTEDSGLLNEV